MNRAQKIEIRAGSGENFKNSKGSGTRQKTENHAIPNLSWPVVSSFIGIRVPGIVWSRLTLRPHWRGASRLLEYKQNATAASSAGLLFGIVLT
jgi:hypothetical protein